MKTLKWDTRLKQSFGVAEIFKKGGLFHFQGEVTACALSCITSHVLASSPCPHPYTLWISDEGYLNPSSLVARRIDLPLEQFILIKCAQAREAWQIAIEAAATGLFRWILLRPSQIADVPTCRKLQLVAEKSETCVCLLSAGKLPHWLLKATIQS